MVPAVWQFSHHRSQATRLPAGIDGVKQVLDARAKKASRFSRLFFRPFAWIVNHFHFLMSDLENRLLCECFFDRGRRPDGPPKPVYPVRSLIPPPAGQFFYILRQFYGVDRA